MADHGWLGPIEWASASRPMPGENTCGDRSIAIEISKTAALFGVLDGLGHGGQAAQAATRGVEILGQDPSRPLGVLAQLCHRALTDSRGVAMTLARIDFEADLLSWTGIGNVDAHLVVKSPSGIEVRSSARLTSGIVGFRIPETVDTQTISMKPGDLLVMASDGISGDHLDGIDFAAPAQAIAEQILQGHAKDNDDATVLTARHRGVSG
jgi:phosphoserine phosphatase RsbX